jgi:hypothetical protein
MATRNYFVREIESWNAWNPIGNWDQYRNSYMFSIPAQIAVAYPNSIKMNDTRCIIDMDITWGAGGGHFSEYAPKPEYADGPVMRNRGIMAGLLYHTIGTTTQSYGKITSGGDLVYFDNSERKIITPNTTAWGWTSTDYDYIGWGGGGNNFKYRILSWCQKNIHETFLKSFSPILDQVWINVNIVLNRSTLQHLIYPGNDPLATETYNLDDISDRVAFKSLTDWS